MSTRELLQLESFYEQFHANAVDMVDRWPLGYFDRVRTELKRTILEAHGAGDVQRAQLATLTLLGLATAQITLGRRQVEAQSSAPNPEP